MTQDANFLLKCWNVSVVGYGIERIVAASRGAALAQAWRSDVFNAISFGQFLKMGSAWRAALVDEDFGKPITVNGKPAFFVERNRQYVRFAYPGGKAVLNVHPSEVEPEHFRPEFYRSDAPAAIA